MKKFISTLLVLVMVLTAIPYGFAEDVENVLAETAVAAEIVNETTDAEEQPVQEPEQEEPVVAEPVAEEPEQEEPVAEEPEQEEPEQEEPVAEEPEQEPEQEEPTEEEPAEEETEEEELAAEELPLAVNAVCNTRYAFAGEGEIAVDVQVLGGAAPYTVLVTAEQNGAAVDTQEFALVEAGTISYRFAPQEFGEVTVSLTVTDAEGAEAAESFTVPVAEHDRESVEDAVQGVSLTGDWRKDLVAVAKSQLGYEESDRDFVIDEDGVKKGYSLYGDWYGQYYADWCAIFVSFCAEHAGIPQAAMPKNASANGWKNHIAGLGAYEDKDYEPAVGDIVFLGDEGIDHMGIVIAVNGSGITTIEGNASNAVAQREYSLNDKAIQGYANTAKLMAAFGLLEAEPVEEEPVAEEPVEDEEPVDEEPVEDEKPVDEEPAEGEEPVEDEEPAEAVEILYTAFVVAEGENGLPIYAEKDAETEPVGYAAVGEIVSVLAEEEGWLLISTKADVKGYAEAALLVKIQLESAEVEDQLGDGAAPSVISVTFSGSAKAYEAIPLTVKTDTNAEFLFMYAEEREWGLQGAWAENETTCRDEGGYRIWEVEYTFLNSGNRTLNFYASADGKTEGSGKPVTINVQSGKMPEQAVLAAKFASAQAAQGKAVGIEVETTAAAQYLQMVEEWGTEVTRWNAEGNSMVSGDRRIWNVSYAFSYAAEFPRVMTFKASADGKNWSAGKSASVSVVEEADLIPSVQNVTFSGTPLAYRAIPLTVKTDKNAKYLFMYAEERSWGLQGAWAATEQNSRVEGDALVWYVEYTFTNGGSRALNFYASKNGRTEGTGRSVNIDVQNAVVPEQVVMSAKFTAAQVVRNKAAEIEVETTVGAKYLHMIEEWGTEVTRWDAEKNSTVSGSKRVWHISYAFSYAAEFPRVMTFKASADGENLSAGKSASISVIEPPAVLSASFAGQAYAYLPIQLTVKTDKTADYLFMYAEMREWGLQGAWVAMDGVNSHVEGEYRIWDVEYMFINGGDRTLNFYASQDGVIEGIGKAVNVSVQANTKPEQVVTTASFTTSQVEQGKPATIEVETSVSAKYLHMFSEWGNEVTNWEAAGNSIVNGDVRKWTVTYSFSLAAEFPRVMTFKASADKLNFSAGKSASILVVEELPDVKEGYIVENGVVLGYNGPMPTELNIPDEVDGQTITRIGDNAFAGCVNVTSVRIPKYVTAVGEKAFYGCAKLSDVQFAGVDDLYLVDIGDSSFEGCVSITSLDLPESVTRIGRRAFYGCTNLSIMK